MGKKTPAQVAESVRQETLRLGLSRREADNHAIEVYKAEKAHQQRQR